MKTEEIFSKLNRKNYNKELDILLEEKPYNEQIKSLLLSMLYKIGTNYDDYEKVKKTGVSKNEFIERIIKNIQNINHLEMKKEEENEIKLLKLVGACSDEFFIEPKYLFATSLQKILVTGLRVQSEEVIRNFTGWSWDNKNQKIEDECENLIYQNFLMLVRYKFLDCWRIEENEDYIENLNTVLKKLYGEEIQKEFFESVISASVKIVTRKEKEVQEDILKRYKEKTAKLEKLKDTKILVNEVNAERKLLFKQVEQIDQIINNKMLLQKEYEKVKDKVLKPEHLEQKLKVRRIKLIEKMKQGSDMLDPKKHLQIKDALEKETYPIKEEMLTNITDEKIQEAILDTQLIVLKAIKQKLDKVENGKEMRNYLHMMRYYLQMPFNEKRILDYDILKNDIKQVQEKIINKLYEEKEVTRFSTNRNLDFQITKCVFECGVLDLISAEVVVSQTTDGILVDIYDGKNKDSDYRIKLAEIDTIKIELDKKKRIFRDVS